MLTKLHSTYCVTKPSPVQQASRAGCKHESFHLRPQSFASSSRRWPLTARPVLGLACAALKPTGFLTDFRNSALLSPKLNDVDSWPYAALCFAAALSSLAAFSVIGQAMVASAIQGGYTGDPSQLSFLDLHDGYSPGEARALLTAWGPYGRRLYFLVEGIDCTLYHAGYRGFLVVVANQLARGLKSKWPPAGNLALLAVLPVLLAAIDFLEDAGQVAMVFAYKKSIPEEAWGALVGAASFVNQSKWALCRCTVTSLVVEAVALFGLTYLIPPATENGTNGEK